MKKIIILFAVGAAGLIACNKDKVTNTLPPVITITSPASGEMFMSGDSVLVAFTATDEDMHEVTLSVANAADTSIVYFADGLHSHDADVNYAAKFLAPAVSGHTNVILTVHAEDHAAHESEASRTFAIMP